MFGYWKLFGNWNLYLGNPICDSKWLRFLVSIWFQILFHPPHRGAFHLSLAVLVHYRSRKVFSFGP